MSTFNISERNGCRLVTGAVPARSFGMLSHGMPRNAVIDAHAARLLGVTFAIGSPADLNTLINDPLVIEAARRQVQDIPDLSAAAKEWLATGRQGVSSMTIFQRLTGHHLTDHESHPSDTSDFAHCRRLLEQVPELRPRLGELSEVSDTWGNLMAEWDALCALMDRETPHWREGKGTASETYARMKALGC